MARGEKPIARFARAEAAALRPLDGRPPFRQMRELVPHGSSPWAEGPRVQADGTIELDTNAYSVPWRLIGETVQMVVAGGRISIRHHGTEVAAHVETIGRRPPEQPAAEPELLRLLSEYERAAGGGW